MIKLLQSKFNTHHLLTKLQSILLDAYEYACPENLIVDSSWITASHHPEKFIGIFLIKTVENVPIISNSSVTLEAEGITILATFEQVRVGLTMNSKVRMHSCPELHSVLIAPCAAAAFSNRRS